MKLLICTQAVDKNDPILGFFHGWISTFAGYWEHIHIICLQEGEHDLPENVSVYSLGKELGETNKLTYAFRFWKILSELGNTYDRVFVHMNQEYVLLGGIFWRLKGIRSGFWYNHTVGSVATRIAMVLSNVIFHTSPYAYTAHTRKSKRMPAGIDTNIFKPHREIEKISKSIYFQGRITSAKRADVILEAFARLCERGKANLLTLVGPEDEEFIKPLKEKYKDLISKGVIVFKGGVPNSETPLLYAQHTVSINLTDDGNYDKSVLESLACGTPVITSSRAFAEGPVVSLDKPTSGELIKGYESMKPQNPQDMVRYVEEHHSLQRLGEQVFKIYERP